MKLSWGLAASAFSLSCAAARLGHVFVYDPAAAAPEPAQRPVDPDTARLVLARRLGLDRFHDVATSDVAVLRHINAFGGPSAPLLAPADDASRAHLLVWLDDVTDVDAFPPPAFAIQDPPASASNDRLLQDFVTQAESLPRHPDAQGRTYAAGIDAETALAPLKKTTLHNEYLTVFRASKKDEFSREQLVKVLDKLAAQGVAMTVVAMPPSSAPAKRSIPYGSYMMPASIDARRQNPEALLSLAPEASTSPNLPADMEDFPVVITAAKKNSTVRGILPACFNSMASCQKETRGCSGHGECKLLHTRQGKGSDCYSCACVPTVEHVDEDKGMEVKRKVTYWGGPACQKKDISIQFWLFVGTGVTLAFLVSTIIGMMYSIGSEELPSVIGAGVSGPARK